VKTLFNLDNEQRENRLGDQAELCAQSDGSLGIYCQDVVPRLAVAALLKSLDFTCYEQQVLLKPYMLFFCSTVGSIHLH
jgi:hypothetical protein